MNKKLSPERFGIIKQSPRQASVADVEDLCDDIETYAHEADLAYSQLEIIGVPRQRAKSIHNGIGVFAQRVNKLETNYQVAIASLEREIATLKAELERKTAEQLETIARMQGWLASSKTENVNVLKR
jgi:ribosomal protein S13